MSNYTLLLFWALWLGTAYGTLRAYGELINGVFGQYATPTPQYLRFWILLIVAALLVLGGSVYLKSHGQPTSALWLVAVPALIASPYLLFLLIVLLFGRKMRWN
jgi:hypothetical protein